MTRKEFFNRVTKSKKDVLGEFLSILSKGKIPYCVIGGLAVNAYAEPLVTLDLDIVIAMDNVPGLISTLRRLKYKIKEFPYCINLSSPYSDLRIQIQTEPPYQDFIKGAIKKDVLGYDVYVAQIKDLLTGKIRATMDEARRPSKREKDLLDIRRLVEVDSSLKKLLPLELARRLYPKNGKLK